MIESKTTSMSSPKPHSTLPTMAGLRLTRQRQEVYHVLLEKRDHPTAGEVFARVRERMPSISLATVYNCLDALVAHKLVNQVNFEREPSRFCPNLVNHGHFQDTETGKIYDVTLKPGAGLEQILDMPEGVCIDEVDITIKGVILKPSKS